jgi:pseudooxynicotine oxidase
VATRTHDWLEDEFARGTWAIHRPGWYTTHHAAMRQPENGLVFAGSDLADGWSGFVDGAIESGLRASLQVQSLLRDA